MELRTYFSIFKKYFLFILILTLSGVLLALISTKFTPSGFATSQTFYIAGPPVSAQSYNYEGYYSQEKARNFTDTAVAAIESPDFQSQVLKPGQSLEIRKMAPQVVRISGFALTSQDSKSLVENTAGIFNSKFASLTSPDQTLALKPLASNSQTQKVRASRKIYALAGAALGFAFAISTLGLKTYFKI